MSTHKWLGFFLILFISALSFRSIGQTLHPRVAELEDKIQKDAIQYLEGRFPGLPFSVSVSIEPLRRISNENYQLAGETLPFYAVESEEILDEWDDPTASTYTLRNRIKKIAISVNVPGSLSNEEMAEIQASLTQNLRLVPARDELEVLRRDWTLFPQLHTYLTVGGAALAIFLLGLLIIMRFSMRSMGHSLSQLQNKIQQTETRPQTPNTPLNFPTPDEPARSKSSQDYKMTDPIKVREVIGHKISDLVKQNSYLTLENLIRLDDFGKENPSALGALLVSFPLSAQKELLSVSKGQHWLEAFDSPGELETSCLEVLETICRVQSDRFQPHWEKLLIQVWRLGDLRVRFLKQIPQDEAMAILVSMPKTISVPTARAAFPGSWAAVVNEDFEAKHIPDSRVESLYNEALKLEPLVDFSSLKVFRKEKELIRYLFQADVVEERDIYQAFPDESSIRSLRPPFYEIFEAEEDLMKELISGVSTQDWAMALFDSPRDWRKKIEAHFSEKEKFLYYELLKQLDKQRPDKSHVGQLRAKIARAFHELKMIQQYESDHPEPSTEKNSTDVSTHQVA